MKSWAALLGIMALLLVFTSAAWADDDTECTDFRIEGTTEWVKPYPPRIGTDGTVRQFIKATGDVIGTPPFGGGEFVFREWAVGNVFTFQGRNHAIMTIEPGPYRGRVMIEFEGTTYPLGDPASPDFAVFVEGTWKTVRATGHYEEYDREGTFAGIADLCYPDYSSCYYTGGREGFWVDFFCED